MARYMNGLVLLLGFAFVTAGADSECEAKQGDLGDSVDLLQAHSSFKIQKSQQDSQPACSTEVATAINMFRMVPGTPLNLRFVRFEGLTNNPSGRALNVMSLLLDFRHCASNLDLGCALKTANWMSDACSSCLEGKDESACVPSLTPTSVVHQNTMPDPQEQKFHVGGLLKAYRDLVQMLASASSQLPAVVSSDTANCTTSDVSTGKLTDSCAQCMDAAQVHHDELACDTQCEGWFEETTLETRSNSTARKTCADCFQASLSVPLFCAGLEAMPLEFKDGLINLEMMTIKFTKDMALVSSSV